MTDRMVSHHQRVDAGGCDIRYSIGQAVGVHSFSDEAFRIASVAYKPDIICTVNVTAEMFLSLSAHVAMAAVETGPQGDPFSLFELAAVGIGDDAGKFVAHDEVGDFLFAPSLARFPHMDITAADSAGCDLDFNFPFSGFWDGNLLYFDFFRSCKNGCFHLLFHCWTPLF